MSRLSQYRLLLTLAAVVLFLDQITKVWVANTLPYPTFFEPDRIEVIPGFFNIVYVGNPGAAWSILSDHTWLLTLISFLALACFFLFRKHLELKAQRVQWAFGLIIGGTIGNLIDRVRLQYVIDFIDLEFGDYHYPSFNVADSGITIGIVLYLLYSFTHSPKDPEANPNKTVG